MDFSPMGFVVALVLLAIALIVTSACIFLSYRLRQLRNEQRAQDQSQNQRSRALSREEERLRSRQRLLRRAVERVLACGAAAKGITLVTEVLGGEVLADRPLRSQRTRAPDGPVRPMIQLENGTVMTVTEFVAEVRSNGPPPDALTGPTLLEMFQELLQERQQQHRANGGPERQYSLPDSLWEELQQLDEEEEREAEEKRMAGREELPDAEEVYGKGLPYVLNPANMEVVYILDGQEKEKKDHLRPLRRRSTMKSLDWILSPLLKRKGGVSFDSPRRSNY